MSATIESNTQGRFTNYQSLQRNSYIPETTDLFNPQLATTDNSIITPAIQNQIDAITSLRGDIGKLSNHDIIEDQSLSGLGARGSDGEIAAVFRVDKDLAEEFDKIKNTSKGMEVINSILSNDTIKKVYIELTDSKILGQTQIKDLTLRPSTWERLMGEETDFTYVVNIKLGTKDPNPRFYDVNEKLFKPSRERILAHELGHAVIFAKHGFVTYSSNYHGAIPIENEIAKELYPESPVRHPTKGHGRW
uniref:Uncharacterized protein n=1 Tax=uncultured Thiotrichaceae bacterium TaxID=298394 RepID=A0A6S6UN13_9GAMM|nr:MAG: Unknown protein [uncultured Thiotrichaceae bacterium]